MEIVLLPKCKNFIRYKFLNKFIIVKNSGNDGYDELYNMCNKIQVLCRLTGILQIIFNTIFWLILPVIYACLKG